MAFFKFTDFGMHVAAFATIFGFAMAASSAPRAASFDLEGDTILLSGEISSGDLAKLTNIVFSKPLDQQDWTLSLNSGGGDFDESLKLASFVNTNKIGTLVSGKNKCNSACAVVFLGGSSGGEGDVNADRSLESGAALGFHAPFSRSGQLASTPEIQATLDEGLKQLDAILTSFDVPESIRPYLTTNDAQHSLYDATAVEAIELLDITLASVVYAPAKITKAMAVNSCINGYLYGLGQLPSSSRTNDLAEYQRIAAISPHRIFTNQNDETFAVIPALSLAGGVVGDCKITNGGVCGGVYAHGLSATEFSTEAFVAECQRNNVDTNLVPPNTRLSDVKAVLKRMEAEEPELLSAIEEIGNSEQEQPTPKKLEDERIALEPISGVICNQTLGIANVRSGPNKEKFVFVATLKNQQRVQVLDGNVPNPVSGHIWKKIQWDSGTGFVDGDLVQPTCLVAVVIPPPAPKPNKFAEFDVQVCNAGGDSANLRSSPNPKIENRIEKIFNFGTLTVIGTTNNPASGQLWYKVRSENNVGFVDSELVSRNCNLSNQQRESAPQPGQDAVMCNSDGAFTNLRTGPNSQQFESIRELANFVDVRILERTINPVSAHPWVKIAVGDGDVGFVDADTVKSSCE